MVVINQAAPMFKEDAFVDGSIRKISLSEHRGKWVVLFFYPADFTFVCPTELGELADHYDTLRGMGVEVISVSTDTAFVHKAWADASETIRKIRYPMLADPTGRVCRAYGTYIEDEGLSLRGTFLIDPEGVLKVAEIHDNSIGRSIKELVRKVQAAKHVAQGEGQVCPVNWEPGKETLRPSLELVGKI
tara:strand:+ start:328 stop:891 length:564 start_codon:yes stop_codon:yes gene_type:complete